LIIGGSDIYTQGCNIITQSGEWTWPSGGKTTISSSSFSGVLTFYPDYSYVFYFYTVSQHVNGSASDAYPEGRFFTSVYQNTNGDTAINDMYFIVEFDAPPTDEIEITYPTSTAPYDFSQWEVNFDTVTSTTATSTDFYTIQIYSGTTSSTITTLSGGTSYTFNVGDLSVDNTKIFNQNTTYYSEAELRYFKDVYQDLGDLVATSDMNTFTTTGVSEQESEGSYYPTPTSTATSSEWTFTCDPESGFFANSLCNLARFLFVPTTASIERFGKLQDTINEKPPFGYWQEIKVEIQSITTTTTAAFTLTGVDVLAENDTFKTIKTTISVILWFLFAFWILHRIRLFDFQK